MKKINVLLLTLIFVLSSIVSIFTQTIEDKMLKKREQRILNYRYQAKVGGRLQKSTVLDNILEEFEESKYSEKDEKLVELVIYLSEEGTIRQEYESNLLINNFPEVRRKSCMLLAKLGGEQARDALINVLTNDTSSVVKAEACIALAQVKDNTTGEVLRALVFVYRSTYKPDPNFIFAIINSVKLIAKGNAAAYGDAILILSEIQMGQYNRKIREAAYDAIQSL
ncbi:MAG: HEAT repeat domain-containing protein, partial [Spirochaetes bacterium]|nr:HEAT repeat domain-containing protein [Spirochaetota bacterium]